ncbi:MAG TPA: class I SAM-dependent methyltransferase [Candidatus Wallbacteria bacterium]|nr:class I SAM-dependent methyltransferase [Candidatus Wallbacteria bacterium]
MDNFSKNIKSMFDSICGRYDFMNHLLSGGLDIYWRKNIVKYSLLNYAKIFSDCDAGKRLKIADIASGTGDVIKEVISFINKNGGLIKNKQIDIFCADFSLPMVKIAKRKLDEIILHKKGRIRINYVICDAQNSCFKDSSIDMVFIAFGIRNFSNIDKFLSGELKRIMNKRRSMAAILEFNNIFNYRIFAFFQIYYNYFIALLAKIFSKNITAYKYLVDSIKRLASDEEILKMFTDSGFKIFNYGKIFPFIVTRYIAIINNS